MTHRHYMIRNAAGLFWSNSQGWVSRKEADVFTAQERSVLHLPLGGAWVSVRPIG